MASATRNLCIPGLALVPALVLASVQIACTRQDAIEVASVVGEVAASAVVEAIAAQQEESSESPGVSPSSAPWDSEPCPNAECYVDRGVSLERERFTALDLINRNRAAEGLVPFVIDSRACDEAQANSSWFAQGHRYTYNSEAYDIYAPAKRSPVGVGIQFGPIGYGDWTMGTEAEVEAAVMAMIGEGPGGKAHDNLLSGRWRRVGVGLSNPGGRLYLALHFLD